MNKTIKNSQVKKAREIFRILKREHELIRKLYRPDFHELKQEIVTKFINILLNSDLLKNEFVSNANLAKHSIQQNEMRNEIEYFSSNVCELSNIILNNDNRNLIFEEFFKYKKESAKNDFYYLKDPLDAAHPTYYKKDDFSDDTTCFHEKVADKFYIKDENSLDWQDSIMKYITDINDTFITYYKGPGALLNVYQTINVYLDFYKELCEALSKNKQFDKLCIRIKKFITNGKTEQYKSKILDVTEKIPRNKYAKSFLVLLFLKDYYDSGESSIRENIDYWPIICGFDSLEYCLRDHLREVYVSIEMYMLALRYNNVRINEGHIAKKCPIAIVDENIYLNEEFIGVVKKGRQQYEYIQCSYNENVS